MSEEQTNEVEAPDAAEFDLGEWIAGHHTYPEYTVTVHLDKKAVVTANGLSGEIEKLQEEQKAIEDALERGSDPSSIAEPSDSAKRHSENVKTIKAKRGERKEILAKAKSSALKIVLRKPDDDFSGNAYDKVRKELVKQYPDHAEVLNGRDQEKLQALFTENPEMGVEQTTQLFHYMVASVTNAKDQVVERGPKLGYKTIKNLVKNLEQADLARVQMNINLAMSGAELREEQIDAGFPG